MSYFVCCHAPVPDVDEKGCKKPLKALSEACLEIGADTIKTWYQQYKNATHPGSYGATDHEFVSAVGYALIQPDPLSCWQGGHLVSNFYDTVRDTVAKLLK